MRLFKWILLSLSVLIIAALSVPLIIGNKITPLIINGLNNSISTEISVEKSSLNLLRSFPRVSVRLENFTVLSSSKINKTHFSINVDTLLHCRSAFLEFRITDIVKGKYDIGKITLRNGFTNIVTDKDGQVNYEVSRSESSSDGNFNLDIQQLIVSDFVVLYDNKSTGIHTEAVLRSSKIKSRFDGNNIDLGCLASLTITKFGFSNTLINSPLETTLELNLNQSDSTLVLNKSSVSFPGLNFVVDGNISKKGYVNISAVALGENLNQVIRILPDSLQNKLSRYGFKGSVKAEVKLKGYTGKTTIPSIDASFSVKNGSVSQRGTAVSAQNINLSGTFESKTGKFTDAFTRLYLESARIGSAGLNGEITIENLTNPSISAWLSGDLIPSELKDFLKTDAIKSASGKARINIRLSGNAGNKFRFNFPGIMKLHPEGNIVFESFNLNLKKDNLLLEDLSGNIMFSNTLWADKLTLTYNGTRISADGSIEGFRDWVSDIPATIKIDAAVYTENLDPVSLMKLNSKKGKDNSPRAFELPGGVELRLRLRCDNFTYNDFTAENLRGELLYIPGKLSFRSLTMNSMDGIISGNASLYQNRDKSFVTRGEISAESVDINKTFTGFRNFRQSFIKAENLEGTLTGSVSFMLPLDSMLLPITSELTAEGRISIENGVLKNFEPVKALSGFIELSELENIEFSKLENEIFIRNNYLALPMMDISSSAADFSVSGKHTFDNTYEYHIKVWLSEILSRKARTGKRYNNEFGAVEEDGLGRSTVFLKITGENDKTKVTYDLKAATSKLKESLKNEKSNLKNILREEYGRDSTVKSQTAPRPKFRIEWSETVQEEQKPDTLKTDKGRGINRIFKKKKI